MTRSRKVILASGLSLSLATGYAIAQWWPILICCRTDGTDCYPIEQAQSCPGDHLVYECTCPTTLPDGTTDCGC